MPDIINLKSLPAIPSDLLGSVITIGNFDGLHLGHQELLSATKAMATRLKSRAGAISFAPHPDVFFGKTLSQDLPLLTAKQKLRAFAELGMQLYILDFDAQLAALTAEDFWQKILLDWLQVGGLVIGHDFRFGANRAGSEVFLRNACHERGLAFEVQRAVRFGAQPASSSLVRDILTQHGDVVTLRTLLGRPYLLEGRVVAGQQLGRRIGFPTLNIAHIQQLLPKIGVYAGWVWIPPKNGHVPITRMPRQALPAVVNIGRRPTVADGSQHIHVEAHVLSDLADEQLDPQENIGLYLAARIRDEQKFADIETLKKQIAADITAAKSMLA